MSIGQKVFKLKMHKYKYTFNFHLYTITYTYILRGGEREGGREKIQCYHKYNIEQGI